MAENKILTLKGNTKGSKGKKLTKRETHKLQGHTVKLDEEFDTYYCVNCVEWLENKCIDPKCYFCPARPEKPEV